MTEAEQAGGKAMGSNVREGAGSNSIQDCIPCIKKQLLPRSEQRSDGITFQALTGRLWLLGVGAVRVEAGRPARWLLQLSR